MTARGGAAERSCRMRWKHRRRFVAMRLGARASEEAREAAGLPCLEFFATTAFLVLWIVLLFLWILLLPNPLWFCVV